jgi:hypothetical protein
MKPSRLKHPFIYWIGFFLSSSGAGLSAAQLESAGSARAKQHWQHLLSYETGIADAPIGLPGISATDQDGKRVDARSRRAEYVRRADELKAAQAEDLSFAQVKQAKRLEALNLLYAVCDGDLSQVSRSEKLVSELRKDPDLPPEQRYALASLFELQVSPRKPTRTIKEDYALSEKVLRSLIKEFADVPAAYEAFLNFADGSETVEGARIAKDLLKMPISASQQKRAESLVTRAALLGQLLPKVLQQALGSSGPAIKAGQAVVVYTWTGTPAETALIRDWLQKTAPSGVAFVGLNFDADATSAKLSAAEAKLPGLQIYQSAGLNSKLAKRLAVGREPLFCVANKTGVITYVASGSGLQAAVEAVAK